MPADQSDEVVRCIPGESGFVKVRIGGYEIFGCGVDIGEVASSTARDADFLADRLIPLDDGNGSPSLSRLDSAHQAGRPRSDDDDVISHTAIIS